MGFLWALAVLFLEALAPALGTAVGTSFGTAAGERLATLIIPEARSAGEDPQLITRLQDDAMTAEDQQSLQPVVVNALATNPALRQQAEMELARANPSFPQILNHQAQLFDQYPDVGEKFAQGRVSINWVTNFFLNNVDWTGAQRYYETQHRCPVGGEPVFLPTYKDGRGEPANNVVRPWPDPYMDMQGQLHPNRAVASCNQGHQWFVFTERA